LSINPAPLVYAGRVAEKVGQRRGPGRVPASSPRVLLSTARPPARGIPACFAFAHGGKDGTLFPVDRDWTIDVLHRAMARAKVDRSEKVDAFERLGRFAKAFGTVRRHRV